LSGEKKKRQRFIRRPGQRCPHGEGERKKHESGIPTRSNNTRKKRGPFRGIPHTRRDREGNRTRKEAGQKMAQDNPEEGVKICTKGTIIIFRNGKRADFARQEKKGGILRSRQRGKKNETSPAKGTVEETAKNASQQRLSWWGVFLVENLPTGGE